MSDVFRFEGGDQVLVRKLDALSKMVPQMVIESKANPEELVRQEHVCRGYSEAQLHREIKALDLNECEREPERCMALYGEYVRRAQGIT